MAQPSNVPAAPPAPRGDGFGNSFAKSLASALGGWLVTGVIAVGVVKAVDAVDGWLHPEVQLAKRAKEQAELVVRFLPLLDDKAGPASRQAALVTLDFLRQQQGLDEALSRGISAAIGSKTADADPRIASQASAVYEAAQRQKLRQAQEAPAVAEALQSASGAAAAALPAPPQLQAELQAATRKLGPVLTQARPRVYLQVSRADPGVGGRLDAVLQALQALPLLVPPVEAVEPAKMPRYNQVRYFNRADRASADQVVQALAGLGLAASAVLVPLSAPPGQLELWLPG